MTEYICPECHAGKHGNCNGQAWNTEADEPTTCTCGPLHGGVGVVRAEMEEASRGFSLISSNSTWTKEVGVEALDQNDQDEIRELLIGRRVTKVNEDHLLLDDGTLLKFLGHEGGCSCGAGDYDLTVLNGVDNVITDVKFDYRPDGDFTGYPPPADIGYYRIFVFADNEQINLMQVDGSDGNGYYGTGFGILVRKAVSA